MAHKSWIIAVKVACFGAKGQVRSCYDDANVVSLRQINSDRESRGNTSACPATAQ